MAKLKSINVKKELSSTLSRITLLQDLVFMTQLPFNGKPVFLVSREWYKDLINQGLLDLLPADIVVAYKNYPLKPLLL